MNYIITKGSKGKIYLSEDSEWSDYLIFRDIEDLKRAYIALGQAIANEDNDLWGEDNANRIK